MKAEEYKYEFVEKIEDLTDDLVNKQQEEVMALEMPEIRTLQFYGEDEWVTYETERGELLGLCPMTGLPDVYKLTLQYVPNEVIPELKSVKMYLIAYRNLPIFHEHIGTKIYNDFHKALDPKALRLDLDVNIRGGIKSNVRRGYE